MLSGFILKASLWIKLLEYTTVTKVVSAGKAVGRKMKNRRWKDGTLLPHHPEALKTTEFLLLFLQTTFWL